ncbi:hypothetical protein ASG14_19720 [Pedobacter sp. Leaf194]|nr:hypothetical protein ASG14_19720 [Pedobacter sp. Leaf194]
MKYLILTIVTVIVCLVFFFGEKRKYYYNDDKSVCVTVWKKIGGECLIIPYKYTSLFSPKSNYISTTTRNGISLMWHKRKTDSIIILNNYGSRLDFAFDSTAIKYYNSNQRSQFYKKYYNNEMLRSGFICFTVDIKENLAYFR